MAKRLGILLMVIDDVPHRDVWQHWADSRLVRIFVHAKHPERITCAWTKRRLVRTSYAPEWASLDLVHVMMALLRAAHDCPSLTHVQFLSESCLPLYSARELIAKLNRQSWLDVRDTPNNGYSARQQFARAQYAGRVCKADQWSLLNRTHAARVLAAYDDGQLELFARVKAADEIFVPTVLQLRCEGDDEHVCHKSVYLSWAQSCKHPCDFAHDACAAAMTKGRELGCLFLRKVPDAVTWSQWQAWTETAAAATTTMAAVPPSFLAAQYPHDHITPFDERIWPEDECWAYVHRTV